MRTAILARVSTEEQARGQSVDAQVADCTYFAQERGWQVVETIREPGDSGKRVLFHRAKYDPRPGIARLLELVESGQIDAVLASVQDRYHRNEYEFEILLRQHLWPAGIHVWTTDGELADNSVQEWRARKAAATAAEEHSRNTSEKLRKANKRRRLQGKLVSGRPFGTMRGPDGVGRIRNPETYPVLLEIFERASRRESYRGISKELANRGVPTVDGGLWWSATVRSIITCRWYIGELMHDGKVVCGLNGIPIRSEHDCMVPRDLWEAAQPTGERGRKSEYFYLYSGLLRSSHWVYAGQASTVGEPVHYHARADRNRRPSYILARINEHYWPEPADAGAAEMTKTLAAAHIEATITEHLIRVAADNELLTQARAHAEHMIQLSRDSLADLERAVSVSGRELHKVEQRLAKLLDLDMPEALRVADQQVQVARIEHERQLKELGTARATAILEPKLYASGLDKMNLISELWEQNRRAELRQLLRSLISYIDVRREGVRIYYRDLVQLGEESYIIDIPVPAATPTTPCTPATAAPARS